MTYPLQTIIGRYARYKLYRQQTKQNQNQQDIFSNIIKKVAQTAFGKEYKLDKNTNYQKFIQQVPIHDYEQLKPRIEQSKTKDNILRPQKIQRFAASS